MANFHLTPPSNAHDNHYGREWSNDGIHFSVETSSYAGPDISFRSLSGNFTNPLQGYCTPDQQPMQSPGSDPFGFLDSMFSNRQRPSDSDGFDRRRRRQAYVEDDYDGLDYGDVPGEGNDRFRSFSQFTDQFWNAQQQANPLYERSRDGSSRPGTSRRSRLHRTETHEPASARSRKFPVIDLTDESGGERSRDNLSLIEALENIAEHHQREARNCRRRVERASRHPHVTAAQLQSLVSELKGHENELHNMRRSIGKAKVELERERSRRNIPHRSRCWRHRDFLTTLEGGFEGRSPHGFSSFYQTPRSSHQPFADIYTGFGTFDPFFGTPFERFDRLFNDSGPPRANDNPNSFFEMPGPQFTHTQHHFSPSSNMNAQSEQFRDFSPLPDQPQKTPAALLTPEEAKALFGIYNERWNSLPITNTNIPYPTRTMQATGLNAHDSIWAPQVTSAVSTWSDETVMQANTQAFFLGAVGLTPQYSETPGTSHVRIGLDNGKVSPAQFNELVSILKKEKMRWHPDRLGRRNDGFPGLNVALQRDERARAVFHAVCELMEALQ